MSNPNLSNAAIGALDRAPQRKRAARGARWQDRFQRLIITIHRWLGIVACLYFGVWLASGLVLMYVHFPALTDQQRLDLLQPITWRQVALSPGQALERAAVKEFPQSLELESSAGRPVYRITPWEGKTVSVSAADGSLVTGVTPQQAVEIVRQQAAAPAASLMRADVRQDQWTVAGYWNALRPFDIVRVDDKADTQYYVAVASGEIVLKTTRSQRLWNYVGAVPHWLYFEVVRQDTGAWTWVILAVGSVGAFVAVSGIWVGVTRLRLRKRYANGAVTPFRGWMKWHHIAGILGSLFLLSWIVTGALSVYPGGFLEQRSITRDERTRYAGHPQPSFVDGAIAAFGAAATPAKTARFAWIAGRPIVVLGGDGPRVQMVDARTGAPLRLLDQSLFAAARALMPERQMVLQRRLTAPDEYWHDAFREKPLPVLRAGFDDKAHTWFYIDPTDGQLTSILDDTGRLDRWFNYGVHDVDLAFLMRHRPLWDIVVWSLSSAGLIISISGVVIGWRRLRRTLPVA